MIVEANGLQIAVERDEPPGGARGWVLLVMGLGGQVIHWPDAFVRTLTDAGYGVVRFDNRDAGLSQTMQGQGAPPLIAAGLRRVFGLPLRPPYTVQDMARDALGVLDALGVARAHVVGMSLGGMIAQRMAIAAPERCATLASIMSSSGARGLPGPHPRVIAAMLRKPRGHDLEAVTRYYLNLYRVMGGPAFTAPQEQMRELAARTVARGYNPQGNLRQVAAVLADTTRAAELARVRCPTLVLHGDADPLLPIACGRDTARRIAGARFVAIPGGGHDLAPSAFDEFARHLLPFWREHPMNDESQHDPLHA